jgi:hypothetical protein
MPIPIQTEHFAQHAFLRDEEYVDADELRTLLSTLDERSRFELAVWLVGGDSHKMEELRESAEQAEQWDEICSPEFPVDEKADKERQERVRRLLERAVHDPEPWEGVPERQKAFLTNYDFFGSVTKAAKGVCHPHNHFAWLEKSPEYRKAFHKAQLLKHDELLAEAQRRAMVGDRVPVLRQGYPVTYKGRFIYTTKRSDKLLMFLIKQSIAA